MRIVLSATDFASIFSFTSQLYEILSDEKNVREIKRIIGRGGGGGDTYEKKKECQGSKGMETDRQTDRQIDRQTDREIEKEGYGEVGRELHIKCEDEKM